MRKTALRPDLDPIQQARPATDWLAQSSEEELAAVEVFPGVRYGDAVWTYREGAAGARQRLAFNLKVTPSTTFDHPAHRAIYVSTRRALLALRVAPPDARREIRSFGSFYLISSKVRLFAAWLIENGLDSYSDVTEVHLFCFLDDYVNRPGSREEKITGIAVRQMIHVLHLLWLVRNRVPQGLMIDLLHGRTSAELARELTSKEQWIVRATPSVPESVFVPLMNHALEWVQIKGPLLIRLQQQYDRNDVTIHHRRLALQKADWSAFLPTTGEALTRRAGPFESLRRARRLAITACFIILAGLVGMRAHELLALEEDCLIEMPDGDDYGIVRLRSKHHKMAAQLDGIDTTWVAPAVVREAIALLIALNRSQRKRRGTRRLFPAGRCERNEMIRGTMQRNIQEFASFAGANNWFDGTSAEARTWRLSPHQFRKTFAKWVGAASDGSLYALKQHFKHLSLAMTDGYVGSDVELYENVAFFTQKASLERLNNILSHWSVVGGKAGEEIRERLRALRVEFQGAEGEEALRYRLHEHLTLAVKAGLTVLDCEYGYCLHRPDNKPRCGGRIARRGPSVCAGCSNFTLAPDHLPWWKTHLERNKEMLAQHIVAGASDTQLLILQEIIATARSIVDQLEGRSFGGKT